MKSSETSSAKKGVDAAAQAHDLARVHAALARGVLQALPQVSPVRTGDAAWEARVVAAIADVLAREQVLQVEVAEVASDRGIALEPGAHSLSHASLGFMKMDRLIERARRLCEAETEVIVEAKRNHARDPGLSTLFSKVLSQRREHLRRLARLKA